MKHIAPAFTKSAFHCPSCGVCAKQTWFPAYYFSVGQNGHVQLTTVHFAECDHCGEFSVWHKGELLHPAARTAPAPHPDLPASIKVDYDEARSVYEASPRSSAALLRLAIQKLCVELGQPGKNLNDDIGELVKQGLPVLVQQSLDIVRVVGNNQVHPGTLDVRDDPEMAMRLFELVNIIVEDRITRPKQIQAMYAKLPEESRKQIAKRDGTSQP